MRIITYNSKMRLDDIICLPNICLPMTNAQKFYSSLSEKEKIELTKLEVAINAQSFDQITAVPDEDLDNMLHNYIIYAPEVEQEGCLPRWKSKLAIYCLLRRLQHHDVLAKFVNMRNKRGQTPLYLAICENFPEAVDLLLSYGADPNLRRGKEGNHDGPVPLHKAVERGDRGIECLKHLISYEDCDVNINDNEGVTPLMRACMKHNARYEDTIINSTQSVKLLLNNARVNPFLKAAKCGRTALHFAVQSKDPKLVEVFGPHAHRVDPDGVVTVCGTKLDLINVVNFDKDSVLHTIAGLSMNDKKKQIEIGRLLLSFGANVAAANSLNKRPRDVAKAAKNPDLADIFKMPKNRPSSKSRNSASTSSYSPGMSSQYYNSDYSLSSSVSGVDVPYDTTPEYGTAITFSQFAPCISTESSPNHFAFGGALSGLNDNNTFVFGSSPLQNLRHSPPRSQHGSPNSYRSIHSLPSPERYQLSPMSNHSHSQQSDEDLAMFVGAISGQGVQ